MAEPFAINIRIRGGSSDTLVKELTVSPVGPLGPDDVTTVTP